MCSQENFKCQVFLEWSAFRCDILIRRNFSVHKEQTQTEYPFLIGTGLRSTSFHMYCTARGHTGMEQVFTFARVEWWSMVEVGMLHRIACTVQIQPVAPSPASS